MTVLLEVHNLTRSFGTLKAVDKVSFSIRQGELLGLIGPNGAGKSTLYNLIAGAITPSSGEIVFKDRTVTGWKPYQAARAGLARTFQIPKPYRHMSVIENVSLSALLHDHSVASARKSAGLAIAIRTATAPPNEWPTTCVSSPSTPITAAAARAS